MHKLNRILATLALLVTVTTAHAVPITFDLTYSGADFSNSATATGFITFDDTVLPNPGSVINGSAAALGVLDFSITVSGAAAGNGTFGLSFVDNWIWNVGAMLDLGGELVGQAGFGDFNWCGLFFIGCVAPAPGGIGSFVIAANAEAGDRMRLVSMRRAAVPEPATTLLIAIGIAGAARTRRQRQA